MKVSVALLVLSVVGSTPTDASAQTSKRTPEYYCPMHPEVRSRTKADCPICGMGLASGAPTKRVSLTVRKLPEFCAEYVDSAIRSRKLRGWAAHEVVSAYVELRGRDAATRLRDLLDVGETDWRSVAASHLARIGDRTCIAKLKKGLAEPELAISTRYICLKHSDQVSKTAGNCPECGKPRQPVVKNLTEHLRFAEALHRLGIPEGTEALLKLAGRSFGHEALAALAHRNTRQVRAVIDKAVDNKGQRLAALCAQLRLGDGRNLRLVVAHLHKASIRTKLAIIDALATSKLDQAVEHLRDATQNRKLPWDHRVRAATGLVALGHRKYVAFIVDAFHKTRNTDSRSSVYEALGEVGGYKELPLIAGALGSDPSNRSTLVLAASRIIAKGRHAPSSRRAK